jgi:prolyl oligopeptidase
MLRHLLSLVLLAPLACRPDRPLEQPQPVAATATPATDGEPIAPAVALGYPKAARGEVSDSYHGVAIADPYRWLEQMDSPETRAWIEAENAITSAQLEAIPARAKLRARLEQLWDFERWGVPTREGDNLVVTRNDGLQNQAPTWVIDKQGKQRILLDPNTLSADGTVALAGQSVSDDGKQLAYGVSASGSDWQVWKIRDVATATDASDELQWIKFSGPSWTHDGKGLYYPRYDAPKPGESLSGENLGQKVFFHRLGTPQSADTLVYARRDQPKWGFEPEVTDDGRWLVVTVKLGTDPKTSIVLQDLRKPAKARKSIELLPGFTARWRLVGSDGDTLWFVTDDGAPRGKLIALDARKPSRRTVLIPESMRTLQGVSVVGG